MEMVREMIAEYGYFAIYGLLALGIIGLPIPDEVLMTFVGYLTSISVLNFKLAVLVSFLGAITGMIGNFFLGRKLGKPLLETHGKWIKLTPARLARAEKWFKRYGPWTIVFGYYIPGIRHLTCYLSGISGMKKSRYFLFAVIGSLSWCLVFTVIGYFFGTLT